MPEMAQTDVVKFLGASPLLDFLPAEELTAIAALAHEQHFETGEFVFAKAAPVTGVYWVVTGRLKLTVGGRDGSELLHSMIEPGAYCGEISVVDEGTRGVNAIADCRTHTLVLDHKSFRSAMERNPMAAMNLARLLCAQIRIAGATLESLAFHGAEIRVWSRLMYLAEEYGEVDPASGGLRINHRLSQQSLADSVGLTRVMVNRQLSAWRECELIEDGRGFVVMLDPKALEAYVHRNS